MQNQEKTNRKKSAKNWLTDLKTSDFISEEFSYFKMLNDSMFTNAKSGINAGDFIKCLEVKPEKWRKINDLTTLKPVVIFENDNYAVGEILCVDPRRRSYWLVKRRGLPLEFNANEITSLFVICGLISERN